jgi:hypothetical protein
MGFIPAVHESAPKLRAGSDGRGDLALVGFAGGAEFGEEGAAVIEGVGGGKSEPADVSIDGDAEGDLEDLGGSAGASVEGAVAQEGFDTAPAAPGGDEIGVAADVFHGEVFGDVVFAELDKFAEVIGGARVVAIVDASDFEFAAAIAFGEFVNGNAAAGVAAGFAVHDELADFQLVGGAWCGRGHAAAGLSKRPDTLKREQFTQNAPRSCEAGRCDWIDRIDRIDRIDGVIRAERPRAVWRGGLWARWRGG